MDPNFRGDYCMSLPRRERLFQYALSLRKSCRNPFSKHYEWKFGCYRRHFSYSRKRKSVCHPSRRKQRILPLPFDQGESGTCSAHAIIFCFESILRLSRAKKGKKTPALSVEHMIDSLKSSSLFENLNWLMREGVTTKKLYEAAKLSKDFEGLKRFKLCGFEFIQKDEILNCSTLNKYLIQRLRSGEGPFVVSFNGRFHHNHYTSIDPKADINHSVAVVGYGWKSDHKLYWIFMDSHGIDRVYNGLGTIDMDCVETYYLLTLSNKSK